ncbi:YaaA family protein [Campylobacter geochelonis]|uniref:UPF0246 protein YaaA n=1 Tax=Campylobacter geochelonis TaxID=1780362 RepID=A0A128EIN7_9BACT|nr:YaaA family protein [Campylobacter geochelonis]QKF71212.1 peroxide stress protein YaaA [Campylobacter geochelonis]CZE48849.1 UPF0246 protein YaaA [Campylobacter geochelonis]CZE49267.1 UPF0246 protein YaaA [Campylobacter geochelonis]CZE51396.1 UPF0246 protein YaaA [Campylobacter geochelonis]
MKILFSPSEMKSQVSASAKFSLDNFIFPSLKEKREFVLNAYENFILSASFEELSKLFGTKDEKSVEYYKKSFKSNLGIKAVLRYDGVAYKALDYRSLDLNSQKYIDENVLIFSNLYGVLKADTPLPDYKFKQGEKFSELKIENFYKETFSKSLDEALEHEDILDLRAGFYDKFYSIKKEFLTLKFIKNGKVVSHFAKHYRGIVLREIAKKNVLNFQEFQEVEFQNLKLVELKNIKNKREMVLSIL